MEHEPGPEAPDLITVMRERDTFARKMGIEILEAAGGRSKVVMPLDEGTANALGNVHGGAIFALADMALAAAANSEGLVSVAIQANIHYMAACPSRGQLFATAAKVSETRKLAYFHIEIFPPEGPVTATCQSIAYRVKTAGFHKPDER